MSAHLAPADVWLPFTTGPITSVSFLDSQMRQDIVHRNPQLCHLYVDGADNFDPEVRTGPDGRPPRGWLREGVFSQNPIIGYMP